ncbi:Phosphopantetheine adenylyltransferase [Marinospirillum celere]|uniref:Phosphopantetheine adenylyltransferase n=1 Tax=Marinospirillum celere TaxID=1122252 RepID=A0A1I1J412_9GAMM|nr:pantetheine-phosphate adenylyltransferase [Marinospirillum celere]SFC40693.1 Phosphopantetheine adenylyltransferase [Marinospirillum celere]
MTLAVYPGTFDPLTLGHQDILQRACQMFDRVVLAIAASPGKKPLFSLQERIELAQQALVDLPQVEVKGFDGLLVDFMQQQQAQVVLRGLRSGADFDYELPLAQLNRSLTGVDSVFLPPSPELSFIASSLVREVASLGGPIEHLVHPQIAEALQKKFNLNPS